MAKAGSIKKITADDKTFSGSGVEGQKGQGAGAGDKEPDAIPFCFSVLGNPDLMSPGQPAPAAEEPEAEKTTPVVSTVITGEHVLAIMRKQGHQV